MRRRATDRAERRGERGSIRSPPPRLPATVVAAAGPTPRRPRRAPAAGARAGRARSGRGRGRRATPRRAAQPPRRRRARARPRSRLSAREPRRAPRRAPRERPPRRREAPARRPARRHGATRTARSGASRRRRAAAPRRLRRGRGARAYRAGRSRDRPSCPRVQAAIVARYSDLFSRAQLASLRECEEQASDDEHERLYRLRKTCEAGLAAAELAEAEDELENKILAARVTWKGEEMPLRNAQAKLAILDEYQEREELGSLQADASAAFNPDRLELLAKFEALDADLSGIPESIERNELEKQISLRTLERALAEASAAADDAWARLRERWFERLLGPV